MSEIELEPRLPYMRREAREGVVAMSEKRYLLTESDIDRIKRLECGWCVENAGGDFDRAESSAAEQARFLEAHEHRERTCRMTRELDGLARGWWRCSECDGVAPAPDKFSFCPYCGAKVVE